MQNDIFKYRGITIEVPDTRAIVDGDFVVRVRKKVGMGQKPFARILGITERTLNRWEHEKTFIGNSSSRLLYLLDKNPDLIFELYDIVEDWYLWRNWLVESNYGYIKLDWFIALV